MSKKIGKKEKLAVLFIVFSLILTALPFSFFAVSVNPPTTSTITEIAGFKSGWSYKLSATDTQIPSGGFNASEWASCNIPAGNSKQSSSPLLHELLNGGVGQVIGESGKTSSLILQKTINVTNLDSLSGFVMDAKFDDSAVAFVNGKEAILFNAKKVDSSSAPMLAGYARAYVVNDPLVQLGKASCSNVFIDKALFVEGNNTITVIVLQDSATSSDIFFDGMMSAVPKDYVAPNTPSGTSVKRGDNWMWSKNPGNGWLSENFTPIWESSTTPIGYDKTGTMTGVPIATTIPYQAGSYDGAKDHLPTPNLYLTRVLNIDNIDNVKSVKLNAWLDDGATVYFNGVEACRLNEGSVVTKDPYDTGIRYIEPKGLHSGRNLISVNVKNLEDGLSSDIYFDMILEVSDQEPAFAGTKLVISPGRNATERGFAWYSPYTKGPDNIYFVPNTGDENTYAVKLEGAINGKGGRFHDQNAKSIYKLPLDSTKSKATLYIDISQNYTIELSKDGTTWGDVYADASLAGVGACGESNRHKATFDLQDYLTDNSEYVYIRIGDQTTTNGWGGIVYSIQLISGDEDNSSGAAVKIAKTSDMIAGDFPLGQKTKVFEGTMMAADASYQSNKVTVTGLEENTEYSYSYGNQAQNDWSEIYTLSTQSTTGEFKAIFVGDPQIGGGSSPRNDGIGWNNNLNKAVEKIPNASFIISAGDQADKELESEYEALTSADTFKNIPFAPVNGNHDGGNPSFKYHYSLPNVTNLGKTGGGSDYSFSYGNTLFLMLNSNNENIAEHRQAMTDAIAAHPEAKWKVAMMHFDVYGGGSHANAAETDSLSTKRLRQNLTPVFDELEIDFVLNGHDHNYVRSYFMKGLLEQKQQVEDRNGATVDPNGTMYIAATCSSTAKFYELVGKPSWIAKSVDIRTPQFSELSVTDNTFSITTYRSDTMDQIDTVTIKKQLTQDDINNLLTEAEGKIKETYTDSTFSKMKEDLTSFDAIVKDNNATTQQLNNAFDKLSESIDALILKDSAKGTLDQKITETTQFLNQAIVGTKVGEYSQASKDKLQSALEAANRVLNDQTATQTKINKAVTDLDIAVIIFKSEVNVYVPDIQPNNVSVSNVPNYLKVNQEITLKAVVTPSNAKNTTVTWKSSKPSVVSVTNSGKIKGIKVGKATIKVTTINGKTKSYVVTVKSNITKVEFKHKTVQVKAGQKVNIKKLISKVYPTSQYALPTTYKWQSANNKYAKVNKNGVVTTTKKGKKKTVVIKVKYGKKLLGSIKIKIK